MDSSCWESDIPKGRNSSWMRCRTRCRFAPKVTILLRFNIRNTLLKLQVAQASSPGPSCRGYRWNGCPLARRSPLRRRFNASEMRLRVFGIVSPRRDDLPARLLSHYSLVRTALNVPRVTQGIALAYQVACKPELKRWGTREVRSRVPKLMGNQQPTVGAAELDEASVSDEAWV
jgi:hypothetical protein